MRAGGTVNGRRLRSVALNPSRLGFPCAAGHHTMKEMRRAAFALLTIGAGAVACALGSSGSGADGDPLVTSPDGCSGLACKRVSCGAAPTTRLTGRVTDPAGLRGIYNVSVYVPNGPVPAVKHGAQCDSCGKRNVGAVVSALTDAKGEFALDDVPVDPALPLVVEIGRFRRLVTVNVAPCAVTRLADDVVRLPKKSSEGELPLIADTTGASDSLECLLRNIGIDDSEFVPGGSARGHVQLFQGKGGGGLPKVPVPSASDLWNDPARLALYDIVTLSCEGDEANENKGGSDPVAREAMHGYANEGGHVFATHFQYTWLKSSPDADFRGVATWDATKDVGDDYTIDTTFPKGKAFADWLSTTNATPTYGLIHLDNVTFSAGEVHHPPAQPWIRKSANGRVRYFTFNTPIGTPREAQCGRFVFADLHAFAIGGSDFPEGCLAPKTTLTPQQLALEFLLFDLFACVDDDREPPMAPR